MRKFGLMLFVLTATTCVASANPVVLSESIISWWVVVLFALVVEAGITALMVTLSGMYPLGVFFGFLGCNLAIYFFAFLPLLERGTVPIAVLEVGVVLGDAAVIKLLSVFEIFQLESFTRLTWLRALVAAGVGNGFSHLIGRVASHPSLL